MSTSIPTLEYFAHRKLEAAYKRFYDTRGTEGWDDLRDAMGRFQQTLHLVKNDPTFANKIDEQLDELILQRVDPDLKTWADFFIKWGLEATDPED